MVQLNSRYHSGEMAAELTARKAAPIRIEHAGRIVFAPVTLEDAIQFRAEHPGSLIVSGGTETGLARNRRGTESPHLLSLSRIEALGGIKHEKAVLSIGATVTWTDLEEFARQRLPLVHALTQALARLKSGTPALWLETLLTPRPSRIPSVFS